MNPQADFDVLPATWRDYLELCKPNVVALMILTSLIGMLLATDQMVPVEVLLLGNLGIAMSAASAAAVNHIVDQHVDEKMARTANRPIATGRIESRQAILFAAVTGLVGLSILMVFINPLTAWLTLGSLVGYAFIYTMYLKRAAVIGLDGRHRRGSPQCPVTGVDYFCLDAPALLGSGVTS